MSHAAYEEEPSENVDWFPAFDDVISAAQAAIEARKPKPRYG